ncbi:MAG: hypothetical protein GY719_31155 [bacterium]|nr:hypothetical protein [bacterium]
MRIFFPGRPPSALAVRKARLEGKLAETLADPDSTLESIKGIRDLIEQIDRHRQRLWNRCSLRWLVGCTAIVLIVAAILSQIHWTSSRFVLDTSTRALIYGLGDQDDELVEGAGLQSIAYQGDHPLNHCVPEIERRDCTKVDRLDLLTLTAYAGSTVQLRRVAGCGEVSFLEGGGRLEVRIDPKSEADANLQRNTYRFIRLKPMSSVRYCQKANANLILGKPRFLIIGEVSTPAVAERFLLPAASVGKLVLADVGQTRSFGATDIVRIEEMGNNGVAAVHMGEALRVTVSGKAGRLQMERSGIEENAIPTALDWVVGSPAIKAFLSLFAGVWAGLVLMRAKVEEIIS